MCTDCHEQLVDAAIGEGRIDFEKRDSYVRALEQSPRETAEFLSGLESDAFRAQANRALSEPEAVEAERQDIARTFGLRPEEVV